MFCRQRKRLTASTSDSSITACQINLIYLYKLMQDLTQDLEPVSKSCIDLCLAFFNVNSTQEPDARHKRMQHLLASLM
jgi:hypothetical protein